MLTFMLHFIEFETRPPSPWNSRMKWAEESTMADFKAVFEAEFPKIDELRLRGPPQGVRGTVENAAKQLSVNFKTQQSMQTFKLSRPLPNPNTISGNTIKLSTKLPLILFYFV